MEAGTVETVGAYAALGKADSLHKVFNAGELQRIEIEARGDFLYHPFVFWRSGNGIFFNIPISVSLKIRYYTTRNEFHVRL